jgi:hypothetical protein
MGVNKKDTEREYRKFFQGWLPKVAERLTIILYNVRDRSDLKEEDWDVLMTAYKWYHHGELAAFMPEVGSPKEEQAKVTQNTLFGMTHSLLNDDGTEVVDLSETNKDDNEQI